MEIKNQKGFTLIEILVVIAIVGVITGMVTGILTQLIKTSNKANIVSEVKQNGDAVLNQIDRLIRNSEEISALGAKQYGQSTFDWTTQPFPDTWTCGDTSTTNNVCAIIVKNPDSPTTYTKIQINQEKDKECASSATNPIAPFILNDIEPSTGYCNGTIRVVTDSSSDSLQTTTSIGSILTNTERKSGVSVNLSLKPAGATPYPSSIPVSAIIPFFTVRSVNTGKKVPTVITISYSLTQGISASSRIDSTANVPFETTISTRNY